MQVFHDKPILMTFVASLLGGSCVALTMQPLDVVATRLYNQGLLQFFLVINQKKKKFNYLKKSNKK